MKSVEVSAKSKEMAIMDGLNQLQVSYDRVKIEVLSEGGLFSKCRLKMTVIEEEEEFDLNEILRGEIKKERSILREERQKEIRHEGQDNKHKERHRQNDIERERAQKNSAKNEREKEAVVLKEEQKPKEERAQERGEAKSNPFKKNSRRHFELDKKRSRDSAPSGEKAQGAFERKEEAKEVQPKKEERKVEKRDNKRDFSKNNREHDQKSKDNNKDNERNKDNNRRKENYKDKREGAPLPPLDMAKVEKAKEFLIELLCKMKIDCTVELVKDGEESYALNILTDSEAGNVIGYRGETLDALSLATLTATNMEFERRVVINCQGYREKRIKTLNQLAEKMAERAIKSGRKVRFEPMNSYERRIIHSKLSSKNDIYTRSEGFEPKRYVVIFPKGGKSRGNNDKRARGNNNSMSGFSENYSRYANKQGGNMLGGSPAFSENTKVERGFSEVQPKGWDK